jgi:hypothetical protein
VAPEGLVFVAQRLFRLRTHRIPWINVQNVSLKRGIFFDSLSLILIDQEIGFDLFKAKVDAPEEFAGDWQATRSPIGRRTL